MIRKITERYKYEFLRLSERFFRSAVFFDIAKKRLAAARGGKRAKDIRT